MTPALVLGAALVVASVALVAVPAFRRHAFTHFLVDNDVLFLAATVAAFAWANLAPALYAAAAHPLRGPVNDVLMTIFFAIATKEIREALAPGGPLGSPSKAALPLAATIGGMAGPALVYLAIAALLGRSDLQRGWAIPCATDVAFAYLAARAVFGGAHPAIPFLLLLSIADDAGGLAVIAVAYPHAAVHAWGFAVVAVAVALSVLLGRVGLRSWWLHLGGCGALSWVGLEKGGLHPALALVPIVLAMPGGDALDRMERALAAPAACVLAAFGLVNAGVPLASVGAPTLCVLVGLLVGKPLGITGGALIATRFGLQLPEGMGLRELLVLGVTAAIGFTVALFVATVAFPGAHEALDAAKMGALASVVAAPVAIVLGRIFGIQRRS